MSMNLLRQFYDMSIKTDKHTFTKDLALLVDIDERFNVQRFWC